MRVPSIIRYLFLTSPITRSKCIRTVAICLEVSTSFELNCFLSFVKLNMICSTPQPAANSYWRVKPLSARIWSPWQWIFLLIKPDCLTISASLTLPPHAWDINEIDPYGVQPIRFHCWMSFIIWMYLGHLIRLLIFTCIECGTFGGMELIG